MTPKDKKMPAIISKPNFDFEIIESFDRNFFNIATALSSVSSYYPNFKEWLFFTFNKGLRSGERKILLAHNGADICAVSLLKATDHENKICTFFVLPEFRERGLGRALMNRSLCELSGKSSIITVAQERHSELRPLLIESNFGLTEESLDMYRPGKLELIYST